MLERELLMAQTLASAVGCLQNSSFLMQNSWVLLQISSFFYKNNHFYSRPRHTVPNP